MEKFFWRYYKVLKFTGITLVAIGIGLYLAGVPLYKAFFFFSGGLICLLFYLVAFLDETAARHLKKCQETSLEDLGLPFDYVGRQN